jgi:hypothetical protein
MPGDPGRRGQERHLAQIDATVDRGAGLRLPGLDRRRGRRIESIVHVKAVVEAELDQVLFELPNVAADGPLGERSPGRNVADQKGHGLVVDHEERVAAADCRADIRRPDQRPGPAGDDRRGLGVANRSVHLFDDPQRADLGSLGLRRLGRPGLRIRLRDADRDRYGKCQGHDRRDGEPGPAASKAAVHGRRAQ